MNRQKYLKVSAAALTALNLGCATPSIIKSNRDGRSDGDDEISHYNRVSKQVQAKLRQELRAQLPKSDDKVFSHCTNIGMDSKHSPSSADLRAVISDAVMQAIKGKCFNRECYERDNSTKSLDLYCLEPKHCTLFLGSGEKRKVVKNVNLFLPYRSTPLYIGSISISNIRTGSHYVGEHKNLGSQKHTTAVCTAFSSTISCDEVKTVSRCFKNNN